MRRSKQQILLRLLPGKTFDYERVAAIAKVESIRGVPVTELGIGSVLRKIGAEARSWQATFRPGLPDATLNDPSRFILLDPREVSSALFPKVLWCQNRSCGIVLNAENFQILPTQCAVCRGALAQLRFVRVHRCGEIQSLRAPNCANCQTARWMALDTRGSERLSNFRWVCRNRNCTQTQSVNPIACTACQWPNPDQRLMEIEVHRAGRTYYPHTTVLLNLPTRAFEAFLNVPEWESVAAAKFFGLTDRALSSFQPSISNVTPGGVSGADLEELLRRRDAGDIDDAQLVAEMTRLNQQSRQRQQTGSAAGLAQTLVERTGVSRAIWEAAGQELLEAVLPLENNAYADLETKSNDPDYRKAFTTAQRLGLKIKQLSDFPILTATYGFSRVSVEPDQCYLKPFPAEREYNGKYPIYVDQVQADALLVSLDPERVWRWLERNGYAPVLPAGTDPAAARRAYFVELLTATDASQLIGRATLTADTPEARMVFGLLHTLSHLCVRQAALLCGLDTTSLSEYLLPRALTLALYANHRSGATIGALTALFEQTLAEWLNAIRDNRRCVYDPVCYEREGGCHACAHLAETSCRFFNLNLNRAFLFGGNDQQLGAIDVGYFDPSVSG